MTDEYVTPSEYRKISQTETTTPTGHKFLIHAPDVTVVLKHLDTLKDLQGKTTTELTGDQTLRMTNFLRELLPSTIIQPKVAEEGSDTVLGVNDLVFGDQIHLAMEGIKLSGLSGDNIPKIQDFQNPQVPQL
jgi:hypothetical protein